MSNPNLHPTSLYDLSIGVGYCSLALLWNHLSLSRDGILGVGRTNFLNNIFTYSSLTINLNCLLLTVELDLDQGDVRHGGELSLNLTINSGISLSISCSMLSFSLYLGKFCNWLLDREILLLNHLWEYLHLCFESIKSELLTIWQSGPSETHRRTQKLAVNICISIF